MVFCAPLISSPISPTYPQLKESGSCLCTLTSIIYGFTLLGAIPASASVDHTLISNFYEGLVNR